MSEYEVLGVYATFLIIAGILCIVPYIFVSLGLMKMADRDNVPNSWLAFIPFGNIYIMGELLTKKLNTLDWLKFIEGNGGKKLLILYLIGVAASMIPLVQIIASLAVSVFGFVVLHWLFERYSDKAVLLTVLNIITFGIVGSFAIFAIRNNRKKY